MRTAQWPWTRPMAKFDRSNLREIGWLGLAVGAVAAACSGSPNPNQAVIGGGGSTRAGASGNGGSVVGGGTVATGGANPAGGSRGVATAGSQSTGGASSAGGSPSTGGSENGGASSGAGGSLASGGAPSTGGGENGGASGTGGSLASGGAPNTGGSRSVGGTTAVGGSLATGGSTATGGSAAGGGNTVTGGAVTAGGTKAMGGVTNTGGTSNATGGIRTTGGTTTAGGSDSTGGNPSAGGTTGTGGAGTAGVRIVGRTAPGTTAGSVEYSWPGVNVNARFTGTQVSMDMNDGSNQNRFTVVVDSGTPKTVTTVPGQTSLALATGLSSGTHDLVVWRNTEASPGGISQFIDFSNFGAGGASMAPAAAPDRRIEVIGDSLSVGAGVEGDATCSGGINAYTNNYLAYGSVAARAVSADVVTIAWSGIGVYRNYGETTPTAASLTMPKRYPYAIPDTILWDFTLYQPQVVVINLGTNDFGSGDPGTPYEDAYVAFIQSIRTKYASAYFILIDMYGGNRLTRINDVVATLKNSGESKVETLSVSSAQNNLGCNQHPNVAGQQAMGTVLATRLKSLMGW
ncbi:MAG: GDSL-type esterase/lipase family protein [Polyangia bacterium]